MVRSLFWMTKGNKHRKGSTDESIRDLKDTQFLLKKLYTYLGTNKVVTEPRAQLSMSPIPSPMAFLANPEKRKKKKKRKNSHTKKPPQIPCKERRTESSIIKRYKMTKETNFFSMQLNLKKELHTQST